MRGDCVRRTIDDSNLCGISNIDEDTMAHRVNLQCLWMCIHRQVVDDRQLDRIHNRDTPRCRGCAAAMTHIRSFVASS